MPQRLENFLVFQIGWVGCVGAVAYGLPLIGLLIAIVVTGCARYASRSRQLR